MNPDIPKTFGWHIPRFAINDLEAKTDNLEDRLYRGENSFSFNFKAHTNLLISMVIQ
jgi:hypothetical protein